MERVDAVIIGAGHNGLVAAFYLARAGLSVQVFEQRERPGGFVDADELLPGYVCSLPQILYGMPADLLADLRLFERGLELAPPGGRRFLQPGGGSVAPQPTPAWQAYWRRLVGLLRAGGAPPDPDARAFLDRARHLSMLELVQDYFPGDPAQQGAHLGWAVGAEPGPLAPGSVWAHATHTLYAGGPAGYPRGGMGRLAGLLAAAAREAGARIECGAPVAAAGPDFVALAGGRRIAARWVLDATGAPPGGYLKIAAALDRLPAAAGAGDASVWVCPAPDYVRAAWAGGEPVLALAFPSVHDPSLAPPGGHVLHLLAAPAVAPEQTLAAAARWLPDLPACIRRWRAYAPADLAARCGGGPFPGAIPAASRAWPGGMITGEPGRRAAQQVLSSRENGHPATP